MTESLIEETVEKYTNVQVDSQVLSTFMSCPCKYNYVFNRKLVPITGVSKSIQKGQLAHLGLHAYWQERILTNDYQQASKKGLEKAKLESIKFSNLEASDCLDVFHQLVQYFKFIMNLSWRPVFAEQHFRFLAYEDSNLKLRIYLTGRIDLGFENPSNKQVIPVDNKTESERWFYSQMSNQFKIYCIACKSNVLGVQRFGFQKTLTDDQRFKMELLSFDQDVLEEFRTITLPHYVKQMLVCNEEGYFPMNSASCISGHFACQFSDKYNGGICNVHRQVREQKLDRYFTIGQDWNPELI